LNTNFRLKRTLLIGIPVFLVSFYAQFVIHDVITYRAVTDKSHGCCGFVSENRLARPVTYALVDEWTTPVWSENAIRSERWLTVDGMVNGERKFWRILQREPIVAVAQ
jgi:hypothetical protein